MPHSERYTTVGVRVSEAERDALQHFAHAQDLTISQILRKGMRLVLGQALPTPPALQPSGPTTEGPNLQGEPANG